MLLETPPRPQEEISVVNPRRARRFAERWASAARQTRSMRQVLCEYALRMRWVPWVPLSRAALRLRGITRAIEDLVAMPTQEKNRQHSLLVVAPYPR